MLIFVILVGRGVTRAVGEVAAQLAATKADVIVLEAFAFVTYRRPRGLDQPCIMIFGGWIRVKKPPRGEP